MSVDDNMRKQWEVAKDEKERTDALLATSRSALDDLRRSIDDAMDELARLAETYACLSLSGSFSAPLEKAIWLLEQRCNGMEEKGVSLEMLAKVRGSLEHMKGRLDLLRTAREKVRVGVRKVRNANRLVKGLQESVQRTEGVQEDIQMVDEKAEVVQEGYPKPEGEAPEGEAQEGLWKVLEAVRARARNFKLWR
jgi:chromosome segregation ATPase